MIIDDYYFTLLTGKNNKNFVLFGIFTNFVEKFICLFIWKLH